MLVLSVHVVNRQRDISNVLGGNMQTSYNKWDIKKEKQGVKVFIIKMK